MEITTPPRKVQDRPGPLRRTFSDYLHAQMWPAFLINKPLRRTIIVSVTLVTMGLDFLTGPTIRFPAVYAFPILLASWYEGLWEGVAVGLCVIGGRLMMEGYLWPIVPWPISDSLVNAAMALPMIIILAWFTSLAGRLSLEVKVLWGLVPICMYCHRIRDDRNTWQALEDYLEQRSQASFTHGICPSCLKARS